MNKLQLRTKLRRKVQDVASVQWTDSEMDEALNQAYYDLQAEVHAINPEAIVYWDTLDLTAGQPWYPMPPSFGIIAVSVRPSITADYVKLDEKLYEDIKSFMGTTQYFTRRGEWIGIYPIPTVTVVNGIELMHKPINTLTVDSDEPRLKLPLHNAIVLAAKIDLLGDTNEDSKDDRAKLSTIIQSLPKWYNLDSSNAESFSPRGL